MGNTNQSRKAEFVAARVPAEALAWAAASYWGGEPQGDDIAWVVQALRAEWDSRPWTRYGRMSVEEAESYLMALEAALADWETTPEARQEAVAIAAAQAESDASEARVRERYQALKSRTLPVSEMSDTEVHAEHRLAEGEWVAVRTERVRTLRAATAAERLGLVRQYPAAAGWADDTGKLSGPGRHRLPESVRPVYDRLSERMTALQCIGRAAESVPGIAPPERLAELRGRVEAIEANRRRELADYAGDSAYGWEGGLSAD